MTSNEAIIDEIVKMKSTILIVMRDISEVKEMSKENQRTLKGSNGDTSGIVTEFAVMQTQIGIMSVSLTEIKNFAKWAAVFLLGLFLTSLYQIVTNQEVQRITTEVIKIVTATPAP